MPVTTPVQNLIDIAMSLLRQNGVRSTNEFSEAQKLMYASQAAREMQRQLSLANKQMYYETFLFDMEAGVSQYDLDTITTGTFRRLIRLRRMDGVRPWVVRKIQGGWVKFEEYEAAYPNPTIARGRQVAMLNGSTLWIAPPPAQTVVDAFEALVETKIVPAGGFTDAATDELAPTPDEWVDFGGWWMAYLATQQDEETGEVFRKTAVTMLASLRSDENHNFRGEPRVAAPMDDGGSDW